MSNARKLADNLPVEGSLSGRNIIINGAFTVAQRATSVSSSTTAGYNTVDRFRVNVSGATFNQSQQTVTVGGETGLPTQFTKFLRHECTTGNDNHFIMTRIEDVAKFQGNMVLSFYAKGSNPSTLGKLSVKFHQHFGSGGSSDVYTTAQDLTLTGTWQRFTFNVTMASITGKTVGAGNYGGVLFGQDTNASTEAWTLDITGVQLEAGPQSTPFEHEPVGVTLSKCQRYLQMLIKHNENDDQQIGSYYNSTRAFISIPHKVSMRAIPTVSVVGTFSGDIYSNNAGIVTNTVNNTYPKKDTTGLDLTPVSNGPSGNAFHFDFTRTSSGDYVKADAEL